MARTKQPKTKRTAKSGSTSASAAQNDRARDPYVEIAEQDVILLQTTNILGTSGLQDIVFEVFSAETDTRRADTAWLAFYTTGMLRTRLGGSVRVWKMPARLQKRRTASNHEAR